MSSPAEVRKSYLPLTFLTLFTSFGTLICCALPALFVALGMGAAVAGLVTTVPQVVWLSQHKELVFSFSAAMLFLSGTLMYTSRNAPCPIDPKLRAACLMGRKVSLYVYIFALLAFFVGAFVAFILPALL
jgi:hypothetical protein